MNVFVFVLQDVVERAQVSGGFFMAYLHQNYLDFFTELDDVVRASEYFSDADFLTCDWVVGSINHQGLLSLM